MSVVIVAAGHAVAIACPSAARLDVDTDKAPPTSGRCDAIDFSKSTQVFSLRHSVGGGGGAQSGVGGVATAQAALDVAGGLRFGAEPTAPNYDIELSGGATLDRSQGGLDATALSTRGLLRMGPSQLAPAVLDDGRANWAPFPYTFEASHAGELAARPRLSARPVLARSLYARHRVEVTTRLVRGEGAGTTNREAPGNTPRRGATSWFMEVLPMRFGIDVVSQDVSRLETRIGGGLLAFGEHTHGARLDVIDMEFRKLRVAGGSRIRLPVIYPLRLTATNPGSGTQYSIAWGKVIVYDDDAPPLVAFESDGGITVANAGWFKREPWGGFGLQYDRDVFITQAIEGAVENRVSGEVYVEQPLMLVARGFAAHTKRAMSVEVVQRDVTAGIELDATYKRGGWSSTLGVEVGRTFYAGLDDAAPAHVGFGAAVELTVQHAGVHGWTR